jgi:hypothetical protein
MGQRAEYNRGSSFDRIYEIGEVVIILYDCDRDRSRPKQMVEYGCVVGMRSLNFLTHSARPHVSSSRAHDPPAQA